MQPLLQGPSSSRWGGARWASAAEGIQILSRASNLAKFSLSSLTRALVLWDWAKRQQGMHGWVQLSRGFLQKFNAQRLSWAAAICLSCCYCTCRGGTRAAQQQRSPHTPPPFATTSRGYKPSVQTSVQPGVQNPLHNPPCKVLGAKDPPVQFAKRAKTPPAALHRATPSVQNRLQPLMQLGMQHPARNPSGARARASAHLQAPCATSPANPNPQPPRATVHATPQLQKHSCNPPEHPRALCNGPRSPLFATSHAYNAPP